MMTLTKKSPYKIYRIEVSKHSDFQSQANILRKQILADLSINLEKLSIIEVYIIACNQLLIKDIETAANEIFCCPITEKYSINKPLADRHDFDFIAEIGFKQGVKDNLADTSKDALLDLFPLIDRNSIHISTARQYIFKGLKEEGLVQKIIRNDIANPLINRYNIISSNDRDNIRKVFLTVNLADSQTGPRVDFLERTSSVDSINDFSVKNHLFLSRKEIGSILKFYGNEDFQRIRKDFGISKHISDCEIECFAQTWSEHCKHKIFDAVINYKENGKSRQIDSFFKTYIKGTTALLKSKKDWLLTVFSDNAGIVDWNDKHSICMKVETHNSPSALDPYGGAITGIVGVNRDILGCGIGARPLFNIDVFCFGHPDYTGKIPENLFHPKTVFRGVHKGIEHGGNRSGIPTINGSIVFDDSFIGKPLVFCGTCGILPKQTPLGPSHIKTSNPGDNIVMIGGRVGKDGIHGATFSSAELTTDSPSSAVQIGDPFTQKKMTDFILKARDLGLYNNITDNGAGGLSSSIGEMSQASGGAIVDTAKVPLKYSGLMPWEIFLSESQERMTLSVPEKNIVDFLDLARLYDTEAAVIGKFTDDGYLKVVYDDIPVLCLPLDFLHNGLPRLELEAEWTDKIEENIEDTELPDPEQALPLLLGSSNIASKEYWVRQYDHEVQGLSLIKPFVGKQLNGPSDGTSIRTTLSSSNGIGIGLGIIPRYSKFDTYHMATNSVDEAIRNLICTGANPDMISGLDNFCWPDPIESEKTPDGKYKLAQLVRAGEGLYDITQEYGVPLISGKDSMKNDYGKGKDKISILPTLLFTAIGKIDDIGRCQTTDFKNRESLIAILGMTKDELLHSALFEKFNINKGFIPKVDLKTNKRLYHKVHELIKNNLLYSIHDISDGGLAIALSESSIGGQLGFEVDLMKVPVESKMHPVRTMFSESAGRFIISFNEKALPIIQKILNDACYAVIGRVIPEKKQRFICEGQVYEFDLGTLQNIFTNSLRF